MTYKPHGCHLIAGDRVACEDTFISSPAEGPSYAYSAGTAAHVDVACQSAEAAFWDYSQTTRQERAAFLNAIADEIEARGDDITTIGAQETGLPKARLEGERGRTTGQLRIFAAHILAGDYLDCRHDEALPDRQPLPRTEMHMIQRPIGPIAVFGASNFPLAFSTAGGDTASALAAGCPVVVKGHPAHPGTGEIVADAICAAVKKTGMPAGVFSFVQGNTIEVGQALVQHPLICAVGFTGSLRGGRALFDLCASRPEPIPFFGELGSVNPMFLLPDAIAARGAEIGAGWANSLTMGAGQFCTNPGIAIVIDTPAANVFVKAALDALQNVAAQTMLTIDIASAYRAGRDRIAAVSDVQGLLTSTCDQRGAEPNLFETTGKTWLSNSDLAEEVFGPLGLVIRVADQNEMIELAKNLQGQLTCTMHLDAGDDQLAQQLMPVLERKAGRVLANGFPTGVEISDSMVHGGPYPASTNFGATSVGTMAIRRFLRPVCYQNIPESLLPIDTQTR